MKNVNNYVLLREADASVYSSQQFPPVVKYIGIQGNKAIRVVWAIKDERLLYYMTINDES